MKPNAFTLAAACIALMLAAAAAGALVEVIDQALWGMIK